MQHHLTQEQIDALQRALQAQRLRLLREIAEHQHGKARVDALIDEFRETGQDWDLAPVFRDIEHAEVERDRGELAQVQAALQRIADGTLGTCIDCGEAIPLARLLAQPEAARCIACQTRFEGRGGGVPRASL
jgi:DnaK suppressor protein